MQINPKLNVPQAKFLAMPHKFKSYVAGFGSGKTWVGCGGVVKHFWEHPKISAGYFAPTYSQIRDIFYPTVEEVAYDWGMRVDIKEGNKEVHFYNGSTYRGTCICRSMDNPSSIVGFKIGHSLVDEIDILKKEKAQLAWRKIIARMRYKISGLRNGIDVTTTPEGFNFVYDQFVKTVSEKPELANMYGIIQASTYDNEANLPDDYIESLMLTYPPELIDAYLDGKFVNLKSGAVYSSFNRDLNKSSETVKASDVLHIGMDFNVLKMAAVVFVMRDGQAHAVDEFTCVRDTPAMCELIKEKYPNHKIRIYPDAAGQATSSKSASESDHTILKAAGFSLVVNGNNPRIKDRINSCNAQILNSNGHRNVFINPVTCPDLMSALEQQAYDKHGMPDKSTGHDHVADAFGYFIVKQFPIIKPIASQTALRMRN